MTGDTGYIVILESEPIKGVPSLRVYGTWETRDEALTALHAIPTLGGFSNSGVLPLRQPNQLKNESP